MENHSENHCPRCGSKISNASKDGFCPACLFSGALSLDEEDTSLKSTQTMPASTRTALNSFISPKKSSEASFPMTFGKYKLLGFLGKGGMGSVFEAEHMETGRRVALKMLSSELNSADMRQRFLREGRLAASVRHPNSLYIFGSEESEGAPIITMEIAGSGTLKDRLKKQGTMKTAEAVDAILDVIAGLEAAQKVGVLHRDVKPSNCFVDPDGSVKVGDFGLSVSTMGTEDSYITATGVIMGTPAYAPPEQLRGDELDVRADIYSVGATLFTLLTGKAPFEGKNAVQVVANAIHQKPPSLTDSIKDIPPALSHVVTRCLAKQPEERFPDYLSLREALMPFCSKVPEPASLKQRMAAGWIDFIAAFLVPYMALMFSVSLVEFHFGMFVERTLFSARYYLCFLLFGFLYFSIAEGVWGAGIGKQLFGLRVIRVNGRSPGLIRGWMRVAIPVASCELIRIGVLMFSLSVTNLQFISVRDNILLIGVSNICPWIAVLLTLTAKRKNGFATVWDLLSGTRVVNVQKSIDTPSINSPPKKNSKLVPKSHLGPFQILEELSCGKWISGFDPLLRRQVWLRKRESNIPDSRRHLSRPGRLRWLQDIAVDPDIWDAYEAPKGIPFSQLIANDKKIPWNELRHWIHDLALELWAASKDGSLPKAIGFDQLRITSHGVILLDEPDPEVQSAVKRFQIDDIKGMQTFLSAVANCVEPTSVPIHARSILSNLHLLKFEKLSYLTGALSGLISKPSKISASTRVMSMFLLPLYSGILIFMGMFDGFNDQYGALNASVMIVLGILLTASLFQLFAIPLKWIWSHHVFGLVLVDASGEIASPMRRLKRWMTVWVPILLPTGFILITQSKQATTTFLMIAICLVIWLGSAIYGVVFRKRTFHDQWAGTWIVRR